ncbi:DUF2116 family Zn-ribbon domain-containing protein [Aquiflexum gelatinilyticum]|uniref:DUF2116 family Zn-ribbon domain-containing protein n=1 Tax=Aquiflexum gelatinilyticum TaxID=2961943 RepID=A0A9X2SZ78_9BACT|nr:DUF2116 family Zn-ribbon domain-containing protein [Aquiflexum gelatinilyticum]MCR9013626.1 DUF2116 family Zn-ribbon domain-containing protein [Aquiflexum gelatinilyticum]
MDLEKKQCYYCGKSILGRIDKKFCDDYCRNSHNNQRRIGDSTEVRNIMGYLKINRNILERILVDGIEKVKIPKERLQQLGYHFKYHTHTYINWKGNVYTYSFEYGFVEMEGGWILVVRDLGDNLSRKEKNIE